MCRQLDQIGRIHIVMFNKIDHLKGNMLLYQLVPARANGHVLNAKVGVVGIWDVVEANACL